METSQYLGQLKNIDRRIKDKIKEADRWRDIADGRTSIAITERVKSSPKYDKQGDAIAIAVDFEEESRMMAIQLENLKDKITKQIDGVENELYYNILKSFYIQEKSFTEIAAEEGYSYKQIKRYYDKSLEYFGKKYEIA